MISGRQFQFSAENSGVTRKKFLLAEGRGGADVGVASKDAKNETLMTSIR